MKGHKLFQLIVLSFSIIAKSQITIISNNDIIKNQEKIVTNSIVITPYDSLQPIKIVEGDTIQYVKYFGQDIYLLPTSNPINMYTYKFDTIECVNMSSYSKEHLKICTNVYKPERKCYQNRAAFLASNKDSVANRYYTIINIVKYDRESQKYKKQENRINKRISQNSDQEPNCQNKYVKNIDYFAYELVDKINNDTILYEPSSYNRSFHTSDYITVGYYEKIKQIYEGKNMIKYLSNFNRANLDSTKSRIYRCTSINLLNDEIVAILTYGEEKIVLDCPNSLAEIDYPSDLFNHDSEFIDYVKPMLHQSIGMFLLESDVKLIENNKEFLSYIKRQKNEADYNPVEERIRQCIRLYGQKYGKLIANYQITLGMTRAMCESAGYSIQYTRSSKEGKVEIYGNRFETAVLVNGIVTEIHK